MHTLWCFLIQNHRISPNIMIFWDSVRPTAQVSLEKTFFNSIGFTSWLEKASCYGCMLLESKELPPGIYHIKLPNKCYFFERGAFPTPHKFNLWKDYIDNHNKADELLQTEIISSLSQSVQVFQKHNRKS